MSAVLSAPLRQIRYRVELAVGQGPNATVFRAFDPVGQRLVALKSLRRPVALGPQGTRFVEQARLAARLSHPAIVAVHDVEVSASSTVIVMEYVDGRSLAEWLAAEPMPPTGAIVQVMEQVLDALAFAHQAGMRHGALKPSNVLLTAAGFVKLADFGMGRLDDSGVAALAARGLVAPELAAGRPLDHSVDIYAAGVLLYRMLAGRDPEFGPGGDGAIGAPRPPSSVADVRRPSEFDPIVARALAPKPGDRFHDAGAFRDALRTALAQPRLAHGTDGVEIESSAAGGARAAPAAAWASDAPVQAGSDFVRDAASPTLRTPRADAAGPAGDPLEIAFPDEILGRPSFDPWAQAGDEDGHSSVADDAPVAALTDDDGDEARVRAVIDRAQEGRRAHVVQAARAATAVLAAAQARCEPVAAGPAPSPDALILAEPGFVPPSESVFGTDMALFAITDAVSPGIPDEALRRMLKVLTPHYGARAGVVLKQVAGLAHTVEELHGLLLEAAGETVDRRRLRKQLQAVARLPL